jgi:hypothetical protein
VSITHAASGGSRTSSTSGISLRTSTITGGPTPRSRDSARGQPRDHR